MPIKNSITVDETIALLNEMARLNPEATWALIESRVMINDKLADHPTIQVLRVRGKNGETAGHSMGILGVLNGMFGCDENGYGPIVVNMGDKPTDPISFEKRRY